MATSVRYPNVKINLIGEDGNGMAIVARVNSALRRSGIERSEIEEFASVALSGDYDNLLRTVQEWVAVE